MESVYTISELVAAAEQFNQSPALVAAALQSADAQTFTLAEAATIIEQFANKPIKRSKRK